ncbi:MAG: methyltransferase domain-containing protein [Chlamydiia bacterium]|nr:methyltransferase domain-containing protein [Chlamydiia bacterium]
MNPTNISSHPETIRTVDLDPLQYTKCSSLQHSLAAPILNRINFAAKKRAFDIGCGDGSITAELALRIPAGKVTGIDVSQNMINYARQAFSQDAKNLDFRLQDATLFSETEASADLITSFSAFHWIRKPEDTLRNICKSITPHGDLAILTYVKSDYYQFLQNTLKKYYPRFEKQSAYYTMFSADDYKKALKDSGMIIKEFSAEHLIASMENEKAIKDFIAGWLTSFVELPKELHQDFLDHAMEESKPYRIPLNNGKINLPYIKLIIIAKKSSNTNCGLSTCIIN